METAANDLLLSNAPLFWSGAAGWMVAQGTKMLIGLSRTKRIDFHYIVSTGGMPSAHSSLVCALATSVGLREGFGASIFMIAFGFAVIVMFDASTVRRAAGQQARILNQIVDEFHEKKRFSEKKLAELLGHTRFEVLMGAIVGVLTAYAVQSFFQA